MITYGAVKIFTGGVDPGLSSLSCLPHAADAVHCRIGPSAFRRFHVLRSKLLDLKLFITIHDRSQQPAPCTSLNPHYHPRCPDNASDHPSPSPFAAPAGKSPVRRTPLTRRKTRDLQGRAQISLSAKYTILQLKPAYHTPQHATMVSIVSLHHSLPLLLETWLHTSMMEAFLDRCFSSHTPLSH